VLYRARTQYDHKTMVFAVDAIRCFFQSIKLCRGSSLQDTLR